MNCDSCVRKLQIASVSFSVSLSLNTLIFQIHSQTLFHSSFLITSFTRLSTAWNLSRSSVSNRTDTAQSQCSSTQAGHSLFLCLRILPACPYSPLTFFPREKNPQRIQKPKPGLIEIYSRLAASKLRVFLPISGRQSSEVSSFLNQFQDIPFWTISRLFSPTWKLSYLL